MGNETVTLKGNLAWMLKGEFNDFCDFLIERC